MGALCPCHVASACGDLVNKKGRRAECPHVAPPRMLKPATQAQNRLAPMHLVGVGNRRCPPTTGAHTCFQWNVGMEPFLYIGSVPILGPLRLVWWSAFVCAVGLARRPMLAVFWKNFGPSGRNPWSVRRSVLRGEKGALPPGGGAVAARVACGGHEWAQCA